MIKRAFKKIPYKIKTILNGDKVKIKFQVNRLIKRKILIDFLKQLGSYISNVSRQFVPKRKGGSSS